LFGVVIETIPENVFGLFTGKSGILLAAAGRDEVHLIVNVPMLIAMLTLK
jgi:hypothetical protein